MAHIVTDRVKETTTTTGTGNIALGGAVTGFQDFDSQMANADTTVYAIVHRTLAEWEVGLGTWNTGNTLSRTTVVRSSNSNNAVNFSAGTKDIFMTFTPTVRQPGMSFTGALTPATDNLAALGSASLSWADLFLAAGGRINWDNGTVELFDNGINLQIAGRALELDGSETTRPSMYIPAGTLLTTPVAGAVEADATNFYGTTDTGNRGYIPVRHFIRAAASRSLTSSTNPQAIFNSPTNGRITLEAGTYKFESILRLTSMSATSGNAQIDWIGAGTATDEDWNWTAYGFDNTTIGGPIAAQAVHLIASASAASIWTAAVGTAMTVTAFGTFELTAGGTLIPTIDLVTAAAATLNLGSYFMCERIGSAGVVSVGQWD